MATIHDIVAGKPPKVDFEQERLVQKICQEGISQSWIKSAHDCAEGGLMVALAECCISGNLGAKIQLDYQDKNRLDTVLFGEVCGQIIVSVSANNQQEWESYLQQNLGNNWQKLGQVKSNQLDIILSDDASIISVEVKRMINDWSNAIEKRLKS